jgi:thiamine-phosphate pyrophosphorylase
MSLNLPSPILYLITPGATIERTSPGSQDFHDVLNQISVAVAAGIQLIQIREKRLTARALFELTKRAVEIAAGSSTRVLVNDRADVASAAGAAGVHLTTNSIEANAIRKAFGPEFLIGVSTHAMNEVSAARDSGADFVVLSPVYQTPTKLKYGSPIGVEKFADVARDLAPFPILALGGISIGTVDACIRAGAFGVAGISLFVELDNLKHIANEVKKSGMESRNGANLQKPDVVA